MPATTFREEHERGQGETQLEKLKLIVEAMPELKNLSQLKELME